MKPVYYIFAGLILGVLGSYYYFYNEHEKGLGALAALEAAAALDMMVSVLDKPKQEQRCALLQTAAVQAFHLSDVDLEIGSIYTAPGLPKVLNQEVTDVLSKYEEGGYDSLEEICGN